MAATTAASPVGVFSGKIETIMRISTASTDSSTKTAANATTQIMSKSTDATQQSLPVDVVSHPLHSLYRAGGVR